MERTGFERYLRAALARTGGWLLALTVGLALPQSLSAQEEPGGIQGVITETRTGNPIAGAQVILHGTARGALTGPNGQYRIEHVQPGTYTLEVRSIGYRAVREEVRVNSEIITELDLALAVTAVPLDEVVVTGQAGEIARRRVATSIAAIEGAELENAPINSFSEFMQGRAPGVTILPSGGMPGQGSRIILRGLGSLQRATQPVIYVDGIRIDNGGDTFMGETSFGGHAWMGLDDISPEDIERVEVVRGASAANLYGAEAAGGVIQVFTKEGGAARQSFYLKSEYGAVDTPRDWWSLGGRAPLAGSFYDDYVSSGNQHRQHISVRGAVNRFSYYASGTFREVDGVLPNTGLQQAAFRANMKISPRQDFSFSLYTSFSSRDIDFPYDGDSPHGLGLNGLALEEGVNVHPDTSLMLDVALASNRYTAGARLEWTPTPKWSHQLLLGLDFFTSDNTDHHPFGVPTAPNRQGSKSNARRNSNTYNADYRSTYTTELNDRIGSRTAFGIQGYDRDINWNWAFGAGWPAPGLSTINVAADQTGNENRYYTEQVGFYLDQQFSIEDYLYLSIAGRYDGHSAAGKDARWQFYPKFGVSYLPSEQGILPESLGTLRLRAAYGEAGQAPADYSALRTMRGVAVIADIAGGIIPHQLGDPNLAPERTKEIELGADIGLFDNRLSLEATYYNQRVGNAIYPIYDIPSLGFIEPQVKNAAGLKAHGFELGANALVVNNPSLSWRLSASIATHSSEVLEFGDPTAVPENIYGSQWIRPGYPVAAFFTDDGELIGPAYPKLTMQLGTNMILPGGFSFRALVDHQGGHYVQSNTLHQIEAALVPAGGTFDAPLSDYVFEADFWRLREIGIDYQVPERLFRALPVQSITLNLAGRNLFRSQRYPGIEVEASYDPLLQRANQTYFGAPLPRQVVVGLSANFGTLN